MKHYKCNWQGKTRYFLLLLVTRIVWPLLLLNYLLASHSGWSWTWRESVNLTFSLYIFQIKESQFLTPITLNPPKEIHKFLLILFMGQINAIFQHSGIFFSLQTVTIKSSRYFKRNFIFLTTFIVLEIFNDFQ